MGLFDAFKKKKETTVPDVVVINNTEYVEDERFKNRYFSEINLTEKNVKVEFDEDEKLFKGTCYLQSMNGNIQACVEGKLIFEVSKRSKAYKELEPFIDRNVWYIVLTKKHGDYGLWYRALIKHQLSKEEAQEILKKYNET